MRYPVDIVRVSSAFGVYRRAQGKTHWGVDLHAPRGTDVVAPEAMQVMYVWTDDETPPWVGYGPAGVLARGLSGGYHLLAHLDKDGLPSAGDQLAEGEIVGQTSDLNHVHWEIRRVPVDSPATRGGNTFDPVLWVRTGRLGSGSSSGLLVVVAILLLSSR